MIIGTFGGDLKDKGVGVFGKKVKLFLFDSISFNVFRGINPVGAGNSSDRLGSGGVQAGEVSLSRTSDASDALIVQAMCTATKPIDKVTLTINNGDTNSTIDYVVLELSEVYISSYSSSSGGDKPGASISLSYTKFSFKTTSTKSDNTSEGNNTFVWDVAKAAKG